MLVIVFGKGASKYLKNAILCIRVVSDQLCNFLCPPAQIQHDELATQLSFRKTVEFLQAVVFVLCENLVQLVEVKAVKNKHMQ